MNKIQKEQVNLIYVGCNQHLNVHVDLTRELSNENNSIPWYIMGRDSDDHEKITQLAKHYNLQYLPGLILFRGTQRLHDPYDIIEVIRETF